jgi:hypothetical protein
MNGRAGEGGYGASGSEWACRGNKSCAPEAAAAAHLVFIANVLVTPVGGAHVAVAHIPHPQVASAHIVDADVALGISFAPPLPLVHTFHTDEHQAWSALAVPVADCASHQIIGAPAGDSLEGPHPQCTRDMKAF